MGTWRRRPRSSTSTLTRGSVTATTATRRTATGLWRRRPARTSTSASEYSRWRTSRDGQCIANTYRVIHPLVRQVLKMRIWGVPLAGGLLLWLITALAGPRNLSKNLHQNIANEWMNNAVVITDLNQHFRSRLHRQKQPRPLQLPRPRVRHARGERGLGQRERVRRRRAVIHHNTVLFADHYTLCCLAH